jgi:DNA-binding transcriptional regulator YiaG
MPNIASVLKDEISRLARKEVRGETARLQKAVTAYRSEIAALKRRVADLEKQGSRRGKQTASSGQEAGGSTDKNLRFRAAGFKAHRERLGLSAREVGQLLDASALSVYKWESGKARPRAKHLEAIATLRKMGKREAAARLGELSS